MVNQPIISEDPIDTAWKLEVTEALNRIGTVGGLVASADTFATGVSQTVNSTTVEIFQRTRTNVAPAAVNVTLEFDYTTGILMDPENPTLTVWTGWTREYPDPEEGGFLWLQRVYIADTTSVEVIAAGSWSDPELLLATQRTFTATSLTEYNAAVADANIFDYIYVPSDLVDADSTFTRDYTFTNPFSQVYAGRPVVSANYTIALASIQTPATQSWFTTQTETGPANDTIGTFRADDVNFIYVSDTQSFGQEILDLSGQTITVTFGGVDPLEFTVGTVVNVGSGTGTHTVYRIPVEAVDPLFVITSLYTNAAQLTLSGDTVTTVTRTFAVGDPTDVIVGAQDFITYSDDGFFTNNPSLGGDITRVMVSETAGNWVDYTGINPDDLDNADTGTPLGIFRPDGTELIFAAQAGSAGTQDGIFFFRGLFLGVNNEQLYSSANTFAGDTVLAGFYIFDGTTFIPTGGDSSVTNNITVVEGNNTRLDIAYFDDAAGTNGAFPTGFDSIDTYAAAVRGTRNFQGTNVVFWEDVEPAVSTDPADYEIAQITGDTGDTGDSVQVFFAYANTDDGLNEDDDANDTTFSTTYFDDALYIGTDAVTFAPGTTPTRSTDATTYEWARLRGVDGQSITGPGGSANRLDIAYFYAADGSLVGDETNSFPTLVADVYTRATIGDRLYQGTNVVTWIGGETEPAPSTSISDYEISKLIGEDGDDGLSNALFFAYADTDDGLNTANDANDDTFSTTYYADALYVGTNVQTYPANTTVPTQSTDATDYEWARLRGQDGESITGPGGSANRLDIAYFGASDGSDPAYPTGLGATYAAATRGTRNFFGTNVVTWIGGQTEPAVSTTASDYEITQLTGDAGQNGLSVALYFAYADTDDGLNTANDANDDSFSTTYYTNAIYVGTDAVAYASTSSAPAQSTDATTYEWARLRGDTGAPGEAGTNGASVLIVYADTANATTNTQSLSVGSNTFVAYHEYTGTAPTLPIRTGITFVQFVGDDGDTGSAGQSIYPIFATSSAGAGQTFTLSTSTNFVTFFESTTLPTLPVTGQTFVEFVGADGAAGASAYDVYVANTTDDPVLTETQWLASLTGGEGDDGAVAPRTVTIPVYYDKSISPTVAPSGDINAVYNFQTGVITNVSTQDDDDQWQTIIPTADVDGTNVYWQGNLIFTETVTNNVRQGTSPATDVGNISRGFLFDGVVTFTNSTTLTDGVTTTNINTVANTAITNNSTVMTALTNNNTGVATNTNLGNNVMVDLTNETASNVDLANQVTGAGNLAANNTVALSNEVTGAGNLAANNTVAIANEVTGAGNLATSNTVLGNLAESNTTLGNLASANAVNAANQLNAFNSAINANTTTIDGGRINTGAVTGGNAEFNDTNDAFNGSGFLLTTGAVGNQAAGGFFVGNASNQFLSFDGTTFAFNGPVNFSNQVTGAGNLANSNAVLGNLATNNAVSINNEVNGAGNLATSNAVNASNQVNGAGNLITANAVNLSNETNSTVALANQVTGAGNLASNNTVALANEVTGAGNLAANNSVAIANEVTGAGNLATSNVTLGNLASSNTTLGNLAASNATLLNNANVSIGATQITAGILANARLSSDDVTLQGNIGNLFSNTTSIDGGQITTGLISTQFLTVDSALALTGPTAGFLAGRSSTSDFGTDGFYIGRTSTDGTTADGFQLSHTSVTGVDSVGFVAPFQGPNNNVTLNALNTITAGEAYAIGNPNNNPGIIVDWSLVGAPANTSGTLFVATADGSALTSLGNFGNVNTYNAGPISEGTVQGIIHDDVQGLRIYEPVFYQRGNVNPDGDSVLTGSGNLTLAAGDVHTITLIGGGGGGGGGTTPTSNAPVTSTNSLSGNAGGTTNATLSGYSTGSYNGSNTFTALGGNGGLPGLSTHSNSPVGGDGESSSFGQGGEGGNVTGSGNNSVAMIGSAPANTAYGAGGGGGSNAGTSLGFNNNNTADHTSGVGGQGGFAGQEKTFTIDLTNSNNDATLAVTVGAAGNGGSGSLAGGAGRQGTVAATDVLDGYEPIVLSDLSASGFWLPGGERTNLNINDARNQVFSVSGGTNGMYGYVNVRTNGTLNSGVYEINGSNSWHAETDGNQGNSVVNGPIDVNVGRNGFVFAGWAHIAPGENLVFHQSQSLGFNYTFWPLA